MLIKYKYKKFKIKWVNDLRSYLKVYELAMRWHWNLKYYIRYKCVVKGMYTYKPQSHSADDSKVTNYYTTYTTTDAPIKENKFHKIC